MELFKIYAIAFFGAFLWNFGIFSMAKNKCDSEGVDFEYKKYVKLSWDDWTWTVLSAIPLVWYLKDIVAMVNHFGGWKIPVFEVYYMGAGVVAQLMTFGMKWILAKIGLLKMPSIVPPVHKD